jgi:cytochrome c oxidase cbb3-type subunit 1
MYIVRGLGGVLFLAGALVMVWNMWMTIRGAAPRAVRVPGRAAPDVTVPAE